MDAWINPLTGDYSLTAGSITRDPAEGLANAVYLRLMTPLGGYWDDPKLGSLLHTLEREKDVTRISVLARQYCEQALQPIIDDGRATSIVVSTEQLHNGRLNLLIEVTAASGRKLTFQHPVKVY
jgi:phage gp46-like protein